MLGILPAAGVNNKPSLNGYLNLHLYNPLGKGKQIMLEWQRVKKLSPSYQILYYHPQLFNSSFNFEISFLSLQQDSIFRNIQLKTGLIKQLSSISELGLYLKKRHGINLSQIHEGYNNMPLGNSKVVVNLMGLTYKLNYTDNIQFPTKGWETSIVTEFGKRDLISVNDDTTKTQNSNRIIAMLELKKFSPVTKFCTFVNYLSFAFMSGKQIYNYEMFRIGGINSLRGFDENYFFTPLYLVNRIDLRIKLDKRSYFFIFNDVAALKKFDFFNTNAKVATPYSFGTGLNIKVNEGQLKLAIALGATNNNITLSKARFHFGYTAIF
jgi:outer membrane protein assembly factor BamA